MRTRARPSAGTAGEKPWCLNANENHSNSETPENLNAGSISGFQPRFTLQWALVSNQRKVCSCVRLTDRQ